MNDKEQLFFEQLYKKHKRLMYSQALLYSNGIMEDAEDVVHDTMVKLIEKYDVLVRLNDKALASYVVYSVRNTAINRRTHLSVENKYNEIYNSEETTLSAEEQLLLNLLPEDHFSGWSQLPSRDRDLLVFRYFLDLSVEELAELYGCSASNIRVRLYRARKKAKKIIFHKEKNDDERE